MLALSLAACGSDTTTASDGEGTTAPATEPQDTTTQEDTNAGTASVDTGRTLVVYFSATGNTQTAAETIADLTGGDLFPLEPADPYTEQEGALDLARAVRFVRAHAEDYGIDPADIAVMGFSAGGILSGEMLLHFDGTVNGTALDPDYVPDALDQVSADGAACGMIYAFYGRLSVGTTDVELLRSGSLPPTFYCYGTRDPFYRQFLANADAAEAAGVSVERLQLDGMPHGFGAQGDWIPTYDQWLTTVFSQTS